MKQEPNNEMDLMLRNLGRAANSAPANSGNGTAGFPIDEHLDADELNAYAENAMPAAARVRYTEHLADCTRCRQMVSQLSLAAGLIVEKKSEAVPSPSGIKAFLSSLFSPMVLRYAVPAVALIAVASIGLMVFRQRAGNDAARIQVNSQVAQTQTEPASPGLTPNYLYDEQAKSNAPHSEAAKNKSGELQPEAAAPTRSKAVADDSRQEPKDTKRDQPVTATNEIAVAPANTPASGAVATTPKPGIVEQKMAASEDVARKKSQPTATTPPSETAEVARSNEKEGAKAPAKQPERRLGVFTAAESGVSKSKTETVGGRAQATERDAETRGRERADKDEPATRSVAGRRFRREGSVWIDVAYNSSRETVNVARGSEQYRALVADEPEIKTIANQLGGEIIVVWKGRAYRIR